MPARPARRTPPPRSAGCAARPGRSQPARATQAAPAVLAGRRSSRRLRGPLTELDLEVEQPAGALHGHAHRVARVALANRGRDVGRVEHAPAVNLGDQVRGLNAALVDWAVGHTAKYARPH